MDEIEKWVIPSLEMTLRLGDNFIVGGKSKTITKMLTSSDSLGIYSMYIFFGDKMYTLTHFCGKYRDGVLIKSDFKPNRHNIKKLTFI